MSFKFPIVSVKFQELLPFYDLRVKILSFLTIFCVKSNLFQFSMLSTFQNLDFQGKKENLGESPAVREEHLFSAKIRKLPFSKPCQGVRNNESMNSQTILAKNYGQNCEKRRCPLHHKQFKTLFKDHMVKLKIISLYIYKELRLKT